MLTCLPPLEPPARGESQPAETSGAWCGEHPKENAREPRCGPRDDEATTMSDRTGNRLQTKQVIDIYSDTI
jgi:hypothetical protein